VNDRVSLVVEGKKTWNVVAVVPKLAIGRVLDEIELVAFARPTLRDLDDLLAPPQRRIDAVGLSK